MRVILGGHLETALVRFTDEVLRPERNRTSHPYYLCLNRKVDKAYFDRAATFIALSSDVLVPSIDWAMASDRAGSEALRADTLGVAINAGDHGGREWDDDTEVLVDILLDQRALSTESWRHVSHLDLTEHDAEARAHLEDRRRELERKVAHHHLCRLLLQVRAAPSAGAKLALAEPDHRVMSEIGAFLATARLPTPYPLPDLAGQVVAGEGLACGLINFSPPDAAAIAEVRNDPTIRRYAGKVGAFFDALSPLEAERAMLAAMREAYDKAEAGRKAEKIFEVVGWTVKPLHYIPGVDAALTLAEDVKDLVAGWAGRATEEKEWYLITAKMSEIAIRDYFNRMDNLLS